ncbi:MAG: Na+/H+ antiporter subunit E [Nitrospira sp.]
MRKHLFLNILLAFIWCLLQENLKLHEFLIGALLGYGVIRLLKPVLEDGNAAGRVPKPFLGLKGYFRIFLHTLRYIFVFLYEVIKANLQVVKIVLSPKLNITPGIIAYKMDVESDAGITLLANSITLTPGTLTVDLSKDKKTLYIHALHIEDARVLELSIKNSLERYSKEVLG